jgi:signal transduction histidine kinase
VITHELRTPITSIEALSRALAGGVARLDGPQREEALALVRSHADHLSHLLESVRDLATATVTGQQRVVLSDVALLDLVRTSASAAALDLDRLEIDLAEDTELIRTDAEKLRRILTNLLENAGRHSLEAVRLEAAIEGDVLALRVVDRGPGLTADVASRAFEKGFSFGTERGSSGLGLWIVRELAGVLGGKVWAEPRPGGGLVVHISLPVLRPVTGAHSSPAQALRP